MHPRAFFDCVVAPNIDAIEREPDDLRAVINAILTFDALIGILHVYLRHIGHPEAGPSEKDDAFRDRLAKRCPGYAALRDMAAALKHGELSRARRKPRVIRLASQIQSTEAVLGLLGIDDEIGGHVAILCLENGTDAVRVDDAIAAACRIVFPLLGEVTDTQR